MEQARRLNALEAASEALAGEFDLDEILRRIVDSAQKLTEAKYVALGVAGEDEHLVRFIHTGMDDDTVRAIGPYPKGLGILGLLIREPRTIRLDDISGHPASVGFPPHHPPMDTFLGVPIRSAGVIQGNLYLAEKDGGFDDQDEAYVQVLAAQAGAAIHNALLSERLRQLAVVRERDRISRDLHDGIIQTLFSIGMNLESVGALLVSAPDRALERINRAVDGIDGAIRELRNTIFDLRPSRAAELGLRGGMVELAREHEVNALIRPRIDTSTDLDALVPPHLVPDVLQVIREALANAAKHAGATRVHVRAAVSGGALVVEVEDDGIGFDPDSASAGRGLENIRERAYVLDGTIHLDSEPGAGTTIRLEAPLTPKDQP